MWISERGLLYIGECVAGDRAATEEEIAAYELGKARDSKLAAIEAAFDAHVLAGMPYSEKVLQIRDEDRATITAVFSRAMAYVGQETAPLPEGVTITWPEGGHPWRMLDDTYVLLSPSAFIDMAQRAADFYGALFYISRAMKDAATAASSAEDLVAIDVTAGWPAA
ncbi:Domain of unknown function DUF4376 [uncultured Caudovirales phage]|uniref:DUF4376 domain-containing protein n=1 Tax=uncultured Caudovirales phage TaxID=2100421 RepID=A0A6J5T4G2_9CAUD|nr:Domain of unknown function DUF4376 [uncultured Caudovirales phage]CAB4195221.1 Domain of unknown function DUF4376 [uncultured Caudovirales phage]CAB4222440.1 Domain of unknown function DUF4376 [uncultured Caudovirales phage]